MRFRKEEEDSFAFDMTPMIDVVFQLLIYFLVTFSTADVLAHLDVSHPSPQAESQKVPRIGTMIRINVLPQGYLLNQRRVSVKELGDLLEQLAIVSKNQTVLVVCADASKQGDLVAVLDACAKSGFSQISIMSEK